VQIRAITLDDVPAYQRLLASVYAESLAYFISKSPPLDVLCDRVRRTMMGESFHLIAEYQGELLGWVDLTPYPIESMRHCADLALGVQQALRGKGIGGALIEEMINRARRAGLEYVHLEVFASNGAALRLYKRQGFAIDGVRRRARRCPLSGRYDDIVFMSRAL
jgi:ribosomal protein S18 acetylase RimI-like enzyme